MTKMDTTKLMAVSRTRQIRAEVHAAAQAEQQSVYIAAEANRAFIIMYLLQELAVIVSHRWTFVNPRDYKTFLWVGGSFCAGYTTSQPASSSALQADSTLLKMGTQVELP